MSNKQSSIEWLQWAFEHTILTQEQIMQTIGLFEQAKAMHKEEIVDFAFNFYYDFSNLIGVPFNLVSENKMHSEFYYDKVYGGNNEQQ